MTDLDEMRALYCSRLREAADQAEKVRGFHVAMWTALAAYHRATARQLEQKLLEDPVYAAARGAHDDAEAAQIDAEVDWQHALDACDTARDHWLAAIAKTAQPPAPVPPPPARKGLRLA